MRGAPGTLVLRVWLVVGLLGCGRLGFDHELRDIGEKAELPTMQPSRPAAVVEAVASPRSTEAHPTVTPDLLELYFSSDRAGDLDIWLTKRSNPGAPWSDPIAVDELNSSGDEETADLSHDGLTMYLASERSGGLGGTDLWVATRPALGARWSKPELIVELSSTADDAGAAPDSSQRTIVFHSRRAGGQGGRDLYMATRSTATASWNPPELIAELATTGQDADPFLTDDGLLVVYDSDRNSGSFRELFVAIRASHEEVFEQPMRLDTLDGPRADADPWWSSDGSYMAFSSSRSGDDEIFEVWLETP